MSEAKNFLCTTQLRLAQNVTTLFKKGNKEVMEVPTVYKNFKNSSAGGGLNEMFGGLPCTPTGAIPALKAL